MTHHYNRLFETFLMMGHNICFHLEIRKLSLNYPQYSFLSGALIPCMNSGESYERSEEVPFHLMLMTLTYKLSMFVNSSE